MLSMAIKSVGRIFNKFFAQKHKNIPVFLTVRVSRILFTEQVELVTSRKKRFTTYAYMNFSLYFHQ